MSSDLKGIKIIQTAWAIAGPGFFRKNMFRLFELKKEAYGFDCKSRGCYGVAHSFQKHYTEDPNVVYIENDTQMENPVEWLKEQLTKFNINIEV